MSVTGAASSGTAVPGPTAGSVTYTPDADFNGSDSFVYEICDLTGLCDTATVSVTVVPVPRVAVARVVPPSGSFEAVARRRWWST